MLFLCIAGLLSLPTHRAKAANPGIISFQGKVVNANGTNVTNGSYNFDFVMYSDPTLGTPSDGVYDKWHELTKSVTVTNGVFQTNLGSATSLPDFNANPSLYLAVRFNADAAGYMSPRVQMGSVPYALNADKVGGVAASSIVQLGASQSGNINIGGGTLTSGNINGQTISSAANFTGTVTLQGGLIFTQDAVPTDRTISVVDQAAAATAGNALTVKAGKGNTSGTGGALSVTAGAGGATGSGGALQIASGNSGASGGTAGNVTLDVGTSFTGNSSILIGTASRAQTITIGNSSGGTITLGASSGSDLVLNDAQWSVSGAGAALFASVSAGSGTISTSGTIGTAGTTTFTGAAATFSGTINLGTVGSGTAASTVHIADTSDATGTQLVTIGSTAKTANILTLQGGGAASTIVLQTAASGGIDIGVNNVASKTINVGSVGSTAQTTTVHIADSSGAAQTVTIGSTSTTSTTTLQSGSGNINFSPSAGNDVVYSQGAGSNLQLTATAVPTSDQLIITNSGQGVTTADVNGLDINYVGGAAAVEAAGAKVAITPGGTTGGTWSGLRIVASGTAPVTGVTEYGIKIEGNASQGAGTETGIYIGTGWDTGLDVQSGGLNLAALAAEPSTPAADNIRVYAKKISGRTLLKIKGPSGLDVPLQPALFGNNYVMFTPTSGATATGGFGTLWAKGNGAQAATTPTPSTTAPAIISQMHRFRHANVVTTTNQVLGIQISAADGDQFWRGNAAGLGGFFFFARFNIELWPANTVRLFAGLASGTTGVSASDTVINDTAGLWHDTTDGANVLSFVTRDNATTTKTAIAGATLAAGQAFDFYMYGKPNDTTIYYRLDDMNTGTTLADSSTSTTLPRNTIFMGPQVVMSNGTANITVSTTGIGINRIYAESDH